MWKLYSGYMAACRSVVFYNSLARNRTNIVRLHVNAANVEVADPNGKVIASQVDPFFVNNEISTIVFKVSRRFFASKQHTLFLLDVLQMPIPLYK